MHDGMGFSHTVLGLADPTNGTHVMLSDEIITVTSVLYATADRFVDCQAYFIDAIPGSRPVSFPPSGIRTGMGAVLRYQVLL